MGLPLPGGEGYWNFRRAPSSEFSRQSTGTYLVLDVLTSCRAMYGIL